MIIAAEYSFNGGDAIKKTQTHLYKEVEDIIATVDASQCKTKTSKEITMLGKILYSPKALNTTFAAGFESKGWEKKRVNVSILQTIIDQNMRLNQCTKPHIEKWTF